jgi:hypothetical protein
VKAALIDTDDRLGDSAIAAGIVDGLLAIGPRILANPAAKSLYTEFKP